MLGGGETAVLAAQRAACGGGVHEEEVVIMEGNARRLTVTNAAAPTRVLFGIAESVVAGVFSFQLVLLLTVRLRHCTVLYVHPACGVGTRPPWYCTVQGIEPARSRA